MIAKDTSEQEAGQRSGRVAVVTCPDCGGALWQNDEKGIATFACHTGHRWSSDTLLVQKTEALEAALFEAFRMLKEKAIMLRQAATRARAERSGSVASRLEEQALVDERHAEVLKSELLEKEPSSLSNANVEDDVAGAAGRAVSASRRRPRRKPRR